MNIRRIVAFIALVLICPVLVAQEEPAAAPIQRLEGTPTRAAEVELPVAPTPEPKQESSVLEQEIPVEAPVIEPIPVPAEDDSALNIVIELIEDDRVLNGELLDIGDLKLQTAFGPASIPLAEVLGIRLSRSVTDVTTVVLNNGDMLTGQVDIRSLLILTKWGKSEVNGANLASIFFAKNLRWESLDLLAGSRWTLVQNTTDASSSATPPRASALAKQ
ncbi:hypothetical protein Poly24_47380 [Rosistilla carotiformis]|uniref:Uncharacterized protein n=1 Tax=Rosistilla carotiformis TaxID=2528017 RepID=A0A518JZV1_9BACT|nr:hypothetical protein [Rosistilla carotiformis]QDV71005.1 hypothetical protein Poly24_47380 [Rosistilla carotiformis]